MHNSHNQNVVFLNGVEHTIGKLPRHTSSNIFINGRVTGWRLPNLIDCIFNRVDEGLSNLNSLFRVLFNGFSVLS